MKATIYTTKKEKSEKSNIKYAKLLLPRINKDRRNNVFMRNDLRLPNECEIKGELQERLIIVAPNCVPTYEKENTHIMEFKHREWQAPVSVVMSIIYSCIQYKEPYRLNKTASKYSAFT